MKHWWRYSSTCAWTASRTAGSEWPRFAQPSPPAKSTYSRPSASQTLAPSARETPRGGGGHGGGRGGAASDVPLPAFLNLLRRAPFSQRHGAATVYGVFRCAKLV